MGTITTNIGASALRNGIKLVEISNVCIDDTQGFDGVRFYNGYAPTLRSQRSGLKVLKIQVENNTIGSIFYKNTYYI